MKEIQGLEDVTFESATTYTIVEEVGKGGMGIVYLAQRSCMGVSDLVVLKTIRSVSAKEEEALRREANIATQLRHENIVKTYGLEALPWSALPEEVRGEDEDRRRGFRRRTAVGNRRLLSAASIRPVEEEKKLLLMVMDYVCGTDLHRLIRDHVRAGYLIPVPLGASIIARMCRALAYAHTHIIHRDISPDNILINLHGVCKLSDFGIAVAVKEGTPDIAGKTIYMAPESYTVGRADERSDIFSLGAVFYYTLTGIPPLWTDPRQRFEDQLKEVLGQLKDGIPSPHHVRPDVPVEVSDIVMKMMHPDPEKRYSRTRAVCDELEQNYLYARGFGPTSSSLAAYIRFFESQFRELDTDDVGQLTFLRNATGRMAIQRPLRVADYSVDGLRMILRRQGSSLHEKVRQLLKEERKAPGRHKASRSMIKVRFGTNLVESFLVDEQEVTIGADPKNRCVVPGDAVRAFEARFFADADGAIHVEDLTGDQWLRVNGERYDRARLEEGDRIRVAGCQAFLLDEKALGDPAQVYELGPTRGAQLYRMEKGGIAFRFANSPAPIEVLGSILEELYAEDVTTDTSLDVLRSAVEAALAQAARPGERVEVWAFPVRSRMVVQIRDYDGSERMKRCFARLKDEAASEGAQGDPALRPLLAGLDRVEFLHDIPALRLGLTA